MKSLAIASILGVFGVVGLVIYAVLVGVFIELAGQVK